MPRFFRAGTLAGVVFASLALNPSSAETNSFATPAATSPDEDIGWSKHVIQSYAQLQEQQQTMLRAIEQARQEAAATVRAIEVSRQETEASAKRTADAMDARLNRIEHTVTSQRERELESLQSSHRFTLIIIGVFAGVGFFGMLFFALFLLRTMNRRIDMTLAHPAVQPLGAGFSPAALGTGDTQLVQVNPVEKSTSQFLSTVERLEKRIRELESAGAQPLPAAEAGRKEQFAEIRVAGAAAKIEKPDLSAEEAEASAARKNAERAARIALLLGKGQALLNLQQADTALACFDEVIGIDRTNADAFVKKGSALERLGRLDEAIDCYDRAIALDNSMTMAYLSKGGVFNRLERYGEALQCYEQALRAQQKSSVS